MISLVLMRKILIQKHLQAFAQSLPLSFAADSALLFWLRVSLYTRFQKLTSPRLALATALSFIACVKVDRVGVIEHLSGFHISKSQIMLPKQPHTNGLFFKKLFPLHLWEYSHE